MLKIVVCVFVSVLILGCKPSIKPPSLRANLATLDKVVYLGDSYLSGYQDAALSEDGQLHSVAALLSRSFENVEGDAIVQPILPFVNGVGINSKPWNGELNTSSVLNNNVADCEGELGLKPLKTEFAYDGSASYVSYSGSSLALTDFSIPFVTSSEILSPLTGNAFDDMLNGGNLYYHRIAQTTILEDANNANPTFAVIWAGMEDVFRYCRNGGEGTMLSVAQFETNIDSILSLMVGTSQQGVIANIPDFTSFPFYTLIPYDGVELTLSKADSLNDLYHPAGATHVNFFEGEGNAFTTVDPTNIFGVDQLGMGEYITLTVPLDSMKCVFMGTVVAIPEQYVLDSSEVLLIEQTISGYNAIINERASYYNIATVDMNSYFNSVSAGIKWNGVDFNAEFVSGGFYSLDGFHPTQKGNALITNEFIKAINVHYDATLPTVPCLDCKGVLFP
ncbi:hypothetical protein OAN33_05950 [Flavobacteriales bacterium]|nr:hypothetical protein [Flavobacteriales bacterium]